MGERRDTKRIELPASVLIYLLEGIDRLDRRSIEAIYLKTKTILIAGRSHVLQSDEHEDAR